MYRKFFGLSKLPFKVTPDPSFFFSHADREHILQALYYSISRGDSIIKVTGDVGCGKTTLLRLLSNRLSQEKYKLVYIPSPNLSSKDLLFYICQELQIDSTGLERKYEIREKINSRLLELFQQGIKSVVLVDEAQTAPVDTLEELRLLSNLETHTEKLLQVVFFGQPEFDKTLESESLRQLKSRISYELVIPPLSADEVKRYLNYRMRCAGYQDEPVFDDKVSKLIYRITGGLPRDINHIADKLLMSAFQSESSKVDKGHIKSLGIHIPRDNKTRILFLSAFTGLLLVVFASFLFFQNKQESITQSSVLSVAKEVAIANNEVESTRVSSSTTPLAVDASKKVEVNPKTKTYLNANVTEYSTAHGHNQIEEEVKKRYPQLWESYRSSLKVLPEVLSDRYTIQLASGTVNNFLPEYTRVIQNLPQVFLNKVFVVIKYDLDNNLARFYIFFDHNKLATPLKKEIDQLPLELKKYKPYVRSIDIIREIMAYNETFEKT